MLRTTTMSSSSSASGVVNDFGIDPNTPNRSGGDGYEADGSTVFFSSTENYDRTTIAPADEMHSLSVVYTTSEAVVAFLAIVGNLLVVYVFCKNRGLRRYRNYYIVGLAVADFLVGLLGIPLAVLASIGLPRNLYGCLFTVSVLLVLCTISILCLVAVSIDRYWATTNPFAYYRNMTTSTSVGIILSCWFVGAIIGFLPLFGWYNHTTTPQIQCYFVDIMDYNYLVFLYFATIVFPALLMACFYGYIYHIVLIKIRQKGTLAPAGRRQSEASRSGSLNSDLRGSTQMMRYIVSEKRREAKAAKKLSIIVLFFMICWMPLYTINCIQAFCPGCKVPQELLNFTIILSHANSALNPFLYAYHLKEFRLAMKNALCALFNRISCGCIANQAQKENSGAVSRSQTMPSIANPSLSTQSAKYSIKFRKVGVPEVQDSPTRRHLMATRASASRDCLLRPVVSDKSLSSMSLPSSDSIGYQLQDYNAARHLPTHHEEPVTVADSFLSRDVAQDTLRTSSQNLNGSPSHMIISQNHFTVGSKAKSQSEDVEAHSDENTDTPELA